MCSLLADCGAHVQTLRCGITAAGLSSLSSVQRVKLRPNMESLSFWLASLHCTHLAIVRGARSPRELLRVRAYNHGMAESLISRLPPSIHSTHARRITRPRRPRSRIRQTDFSSRPPDQRLPLLGASDQFARALVDQHPASVARPPAP
jgi:hypothetical protein